MTMYRVEQTEAFESWLDGLADRRAQLKIAQRILRLEGGNPGDWKSLGDGVSEMRINYGPGYRVYYKVQDKVVYLLLCGSDKKGQSKAIRKAKEMAKQI